MEVMLAWSGICFLIGAVPAYFIARGRGGALLAAAQQQVIALQQKVESDESRHQNEIEHLRRGGLTVVTYPYEEQIGDDGVFIDDRRAEIGYKFQLFVNGIPCFEPHKIPVSVLQQKEVSLVKIEAATKTALGLIENMAAMHPAIRALRAAPAVKALA